MSGLRSTAATSGRSAARRDRPRSVGAQRGAVDRGLAAERAEQLLGREVVEQLVGVELGERDEPERDVAERLGEHSADAEHHARPELRVAHERRR